MNIDKVGKRVDISGADFGLGVRCERQFPSYGFPEHFSLTCTHQAIFKPLPFSYRSVLYVFNTNVNLNFKFTD